MPKHTPGPWEAQIPEHHTPYILAKRHGNEVGYDCVATMNPQLKNQAEANARLIAAAPEMLEVLRYLVLDLENNGEVLGTDDARIEFLQDTINKAEGKP